MLVNLVKYFDHQRTVRIVNRNIGIHGYRQVHGQECGPVVHLLKYVLYGCTCSLTAHMLLDKSFNINSMSPLLSKPALNNNGNLLCITRRRRREVVAARPCLLPARYFSPAFVRGIYLIVKHRADFTHLIHLSHWLSILIPLDLPLRIPVPDIHYDRVRMKRRHSKAESLCYMLLAEAYRLVIP